ncbi:beta-lactamase family protein [Annulohypoxylon truncatum]|uniref:beta-lactamase family protein n=1 Tax=Annulohypoxylon truncatum TaxID=327061 RepID=UPI0020074CD5|nr:beta-lactamase family protein [Annulohypoxylon truncatum]KAI1205642.1 beta-lactamase family protein [Annulohypoxylon truncatum]
MEFFHSNSFSSQVRHLMGQHHIPGLAIAIIQDDEVASAGYGYASLNPEKPCTADTLFDIASCSKSMTAASVALLVEDNERHPEVQWEVTMSSLLPEDFVMPDLEDTKRVTIDDVLSHMTGMADNETALLGNRSAHQDTPRSITRNLRNLPMAHPLRAKWEYCNIMYSAAAHLVAEKSGQTFNDFLETCIFRPLNMSSTSLQPTSAEAKGFGDRLAKGHDWKWDSEKGGYIEFPQLAETEGEGAGCVVTSANDFIKWVKAFLNREGPISEKVYRGLTRLRAVTEPAAGVKGARRFESPEMYAAGLEASWYRGYAIVGHYGNVPGFGSRFFFVPEMGFGAAFMGNGRRANRVITALSRVLINAVLDLPPVPRPVRKVGNAKRDVVVRAKNQTVGQAESASDETKEVGGEPKNEKSKDQTTARNPKAPKSKKPQQEKKPRPQTKPLGDYVGKYWHPGYHRLTVSIKDDKLFIDAMDRSYYGMTLTFDHVANHTKYTAHLNYVNETFDEEIRAEFVFGESGRAVKMGLKLEQALNHLIWFELENDT